MDFIKALPNVDYAADGPVEALLKQAEAAPGGIVDVVVSGDWFDWDSPDYSHFDAYDAAIDRLATQISTTLDAPAQRQQGFDEDTFEPVQILQDNEIYADFFYHWPDRKLVLFSAHEDKELPIEVALMRLP